jgi:hypothetical protein
LREAHAANAVATFIAFVCAIVFATIDGTVREARPARLAAPAQSQAQAQAMQTQ